MNYYDVLGVTPQAEDIVIESAYRALMKKYHPDVFKGDAAFAEARTKEINEAYRILKDPASRARYDSDQAYRAQRSTAADDADDADDVGASDDGSTATAAPVWAKTASGQTRGTAASNVFIALALLVMLAASVSLLSGQGEGITSAPHQPAAPMTVAETTENLAQPMQSGAFVSWNAQEDRDGKTFRYSDLQITWSSEPAGDEMTAPVLTLVDGNGESLRLVGASKGGSASAEFGVFALDRSSGGEQLLVRTFTGGTHCCFVYHLVSRREGRWQAQELGTWDPAVMLDPQDADGDGKLELVGGDPTFSYTFASYAGSYHPPVIYELRRGDLVDVSKSSRFRSIFTHFIDTVRPECAKRENGACAALVAAATRVGRGDVEWAYMLQHAEQQTDWLPSDCLTQEVGGTCPQGQERKFATFSEALTWFLGEQGYRVPDAAVAPPVEFAAAGPSFDCAMARGDVQTLICSDPDIASEDTMMARMYAQALAGASSAADLRSDQRRWLQLRDSGPADRARLLALYKSRLSHLMKLANGAVE